MREQLRSYLPTISQFQATVDRNSAQIGFNAVGQPTGMGNAVSSTQRLLVAYFFTYLGCTRILQYGPLDPQHLRPEDERLLRQVFDTLRYVAEEGADTLNPRLRATQVLANLTDHFGRVF